MYLHVIACEIMVREVCHVLATSPHVCDVTFLTQGYHDQVAAGRQGLQAHIDQHTGGRHDALLLGYGLCNNLIAGLEARDVPLVVPRAHDCIAILLGSRQVYDQQFAATPGTYWYSSGWLECRVRRQTPDINQTGGNVTATYEQFVRQYGEDNARYLMEALGAWTAHYERGALIHYDFDQALGLAERVRAICADNGWSYEELPGDLGLLRRWVHGEWDEQEFLTVPPGHRLEAAWDGSIVRAVPS